MEQNSLEVRKRETFHFSPASKCREAACLGTKTVSTFEQFWVLASLPKWGAAWHQGAIWRRFSNAHPISSLSVPSHGMTASQCLQTRLFVHISRYTCQPD